MEGYTANFIPTDENDYEEGYEPCHLYLGHIEIKNGDNIISKFEFDIDDIYEDTENNFKPVYRVHNSDQIPLFNNFVENLESSGEAKLSFRQCNGERYYSVNGNIFKFNYTDELFGYEHYYTVNESLINTFKEIRNILNNKFEY